MSILVRLNFCYFLIILSAGCNEYTDHEKELLKVFSQEKKLNCELELMQDSIAQDWDKINEMLEENLPVTMPQEEKNNMLKARNANLIRMFESFEEVDNEVKQALQKVEEKDRNMAQRITMMKKEVQQIQSKKIALFKEISHKNGESALLEYQSIYKETMKGNCTK